MSDLCRLIWCVLIGLFRSRAALEAEILVLRHQLNVLRRKSPKRLTFSSIDRLLLVGLYRLAPGILDALKIMRPETLLRWHRAGFRTYWRWKSRPLGGRPTAPEDIRRLIREMRVANPLWGAPRIHGELLKLGFSGMRRRLPRSISISPTRATGTARGRLSSSDRGFAFSPLVSAAAIVATGETCSTT